MTLKYTICGLFVGLWIGISIFYIQHNLHRQLLKSIGCFCLGLIPVSVAIILYFAYNHALSDLWTVYFYNNLFNYSIAVGREGVLGRLAVNELKGLISVISNPLIACMLIGSLVELYLQKDKKILIFSLGCFLSMFVFLFVGSPYRYYPLPIVIGMPFSLLLAMRICKRFTQKWKNVLYLSALFLVMSFGGILIKNRFLMKFEESPVAVRISNLIMKGEEHSPTMIEYDLDMMCLGVYTLCGNVPECKNFCRILLSIKNQIDAQNNYITTCHPAYIISDKPLSFDGYKCISIQTEHTIPIRNVLHDCLPFIKPIQEPRTKYYVYRYNKSETL